ncbi:MAG: NAD(P)/FAD-dependent oxidoreductase [Acidobacteriota bacterium]|nr:NAD(P)/FAD-dependent oxidoreductase [Acidobacteriota bacterium]
MEEVDLVIVGGGVVGLACARETARPGRTVCLLERHPRLGTETSTHNSGVVHAGIYYPRDSLKARLCVEGRDALYRFCETHGVPHHRCGKLIVAGSHDDDARLQDLLAHGLANAVDDLELVDRNFVRRMEPHVAAHAAIWSPSTGIVETEALVHALHRDAGARDAITLPATPLIDAHIHGRGDEGGEWLDLRTPAETIRARAVINAAGLYADDVSSALGGRAFTIHPCRGEYAELGGTSRGLVTRPVYPLPARAGEHLGVHLTPTTWGSVMVGPTTRYQQDKRDHEQDRLPAAAFVEPIRQLLPAVRPGDVRLGGTGIRPKLSPEATAFSDFLIERDAAQPRLVHAAGIDSPGLTACLAIARLVSTLIDEILN